MWTACDRCSGTPPTRVKSPCSPRVSRSWPRSNTGRRRSPRRFRPWRWLPTANFVADLEQAAKHWNYYAAIGLADLPDGAGVPALIQMAQGSTSARGNALEMLAQVASQYPVARAALLDLARANKIGPSLWPYLTPLLAGDQYYYQDAPIQGSSPAGNRRPGEGAHVLFGNQHFYTAPDLANLTPEQISQRSALIDELQGVTSDPAAVKALQAARALLEKRLASVAAARSLPQ